MSPAPEGATQRAAEAERAAGAERSAGAGRGSVFPVDVVVLDIEGTTSPTRYVTDVLYPYSRERFAALLAERRADRAVRRAVEEVRTLLGEPAADEERVERALNAWLDQDRKATPLKTLQGIIWAEGFATGELSAPFYPDVVPRLRAWHAVGVRLHVYSSGSVAAQRAWFEHSTEGDLLPLIEGFHDTVSAGPKQSADSYRAIGASLAVPADRTLFLSDRPGELTAARAAGWRAVAVRRAGEPYAAEKTDDGPWVAGFDAVRLQEVGR